MAKKIYDTAKPQERAVLVGVVTPGMKIEKSQEYIDELEFLDQTAGAVV